MITKMLKKPMQSAYVVKNVLPNYTEKHSASNNSDGQTRSFLTISESFRNTSCNFHGSQGPQRFPGP